MSIEIFDQMITYWPKKKLGCVIDLKYGKGISREQRNSNGKCPIYGANGVLGWTDNALVSGEAVIVGRKGSAGEVTRVSGLFWPSDVTYYVLGNDQIDVDYLFHLLKSLHLQKFAVGVKPGINRNRVYEMEVPLPPLSEQKKIIEKLEKVLAKIKEAKRLRAEAIEATKTLLSAELHKIFEEGKIKGWEEKIVGEIVEIKHGFAFKSQYFKDAGDYVLLTPGNFFEKGGYRDRGSAGYRPRLCRPAGGRRGIRGDRRYGQSDPCRRGYRAAGRYGPRPHGRCDRPALGRSHPNGRHTGRRADGRD